MSIPTTELTCPFCGEKDFDFSGLKFHFVMGYCEAYNQANAFEGTIYENTEE